MRPSRRIQFAIAALVTLLLIVGFYYLNQQRVKWREAWFQDQCSFAQRTGQWDQLQRFSEQWSLEQPNAANAWLFRAEAAQHLGQFDEAIKYLSSIQESDPKFLPAQVACATLQFGKLNRPREGAATCERILAKDPRVTSAHRQLIEFYALTLQRQPLFVAVRRAIDQRRESPAAYVYLFLIDTMRMATGVESNSRWLQQEPDSELFLVARALQLAEPTAGTPDAGNGKHETIAELRTRFPANVELLAYGLNQAIQTGSVSSVTEILQAAPLSAEDDNRFWRARGWLYLTQGNLIKAREALDTALKIHPMDWEARTWLAEVTRLEGDLAEADRLQNIARRARQIRTAITDHGTAEALPEAILKDLADYARDCGDLQIADALDRRLKPGSGI